MPSRRSVLSAAALVLAISIAPAVAGTLTTFDANAFADAQKAGKPILIAVHATWCPTCKAQAPILGELRADPRFKNLAYFVIDFDTDKELLKRFGVGMQSTLIAFKGSAEKGRSVGDTDKGSIFGLVAKSL